MLLMTIVFLTFVVLQVNVLLNTDKMTAIPCLRSNVPLKPKKVRIMSMTACNFTQNSVFLMNDQGLNFTHVLDNVPFF